jgi:hypothetical protein
VKRLPDWEVRLMDFAKAEVGRPFEWGETNCVSLGFRALDAQCGTGLHAKYRHFMSSEQRAMAFVAKHGLSGLVERVAAMGFVEIPKNFEQVGDVQFCEIPGNIGASVILGRQRLSSTADGGVQLFDGRMLGASVTMGAR